MEKMDSKIKKVMLFLIFISTVSYIGYFIYGVKNQIDMRWEYDEVYFKNISLFWNLFRYVKEIIAIYLFYLLLKFKNKNNNKILLVTIILTIIGIISLIINDLLDIKYIICGIRYFMYPLLTIMFINCANIDKNFCIKLLRLINTIVLIQLLTIAIQIKISGFALSLIGKGSIRYPGLFGQSSSLGCFNIGVAMIYSMIGEKYKLKGLNLFSILNIIIAITSGMRSSMIICTIYFVVMIIYKSKIFEEKSKSTIFIISALLLIPIFVIIITNYVDRGSIIKVQLESGRIIKFFDIFSEFKLVNYFFGYGIGYGTNSAINLGLNSMPLDGTFTSIVSQYGIVILSIFILLLLFGFVNLLKRSKKIKDLIINLCNYFVFILLMLSGNISEFYTCIILMIISLKIFQNKERDLNE